MVRDDAFADVERLAVAADDRLRPGAATDAEWNDGPRSAPAGVAVAAEWPGD